MLAAGAAVWCSTPTSEARIAPPISPSAGCRSDLRLCHGGHRVPLADLDAALEDLFERQGVSKTKFKKFVR